MSKFTRLCVILALASVLLVGLYIYTSYLAVSASLRVVPAAHMERDYIAAMEAFYGEGAAESFDISDYSFVLLRAEASSRSPFAVEWITLSLDPLAEDVCVHEAATGPIDLKAFSSFGGDDALFITLLTRASEIPRHARLEYYVRGGYHAFEIDADS